MKPILKANIPGKKYFVLKLYISVVGHIFTITIGLVLNYRFKSPFHKNSGREEINYVI